MYDPNSTTGSNLTFNVLNALDEPPRLSAQEQMCLIINIILNIITYPFTVLLNALVIIAVKTRPTLQSNANATDAVSGVLAQPSFILFIHGENQPRENKITLTLFCVFSVIINETCLCLAVSMLFR